MQRIQESGNDYPSPYISKVLRSYSVSNLVDGIRAIVKTQWLAREPAVFTPSFLEFLDAVVERCNTSRDSNIPFLGCVVVGRGDFPKQLKVQLGTLKKF